MRDAAAFVCLRPQPWRVRPPQEQGKDAEFPYFFTHYFSPEESAGIRKAAEVGRGTINDLAIAFLLQALANWNVRHGAGPRERLRIMMPTSMRTRQDLRLPAANRVTSAFLTRRIRDCEDFPAGSKAFGDETAGIQQFRSGLDLVHPAGALHGSPGWLRCVVHLSGCVATAVLTHVGDQSARMRHFARHGAGHAVGNLNVERVSGCALLRPGTRIAVGIGTMADRFAVSLRYDRQTVSVADARAMFTELLDRWRGLATSRSPAAFRAD